MNANRASELVVLQIADSAFPTGGFAHSGGLESAVKWGRVSDHADLSDYISAALTQTSLSCLQFVKAIFGSDNDHEEAFHQALRDCDAFTNNHVANKASRCQGYALLNTASVVFPIDAIRETEESVQRHKLPAHLAPIFGKVCLELGVALEKSCCLYLYLSMRNLISSAVRLGIVGPLQGQVIQYDLGPSVQHLASRALDQPGYVPAQSAPLQEMMQASHDRIYSRLFRS